jgi:hypothetical protein
MKQLEQQLKELIAEYAAGQKVLGELENEQATLRKTLLRINTTIQVLEEELSKKKIIEENRIRKAVN